MCPVGIFLVVTNFSGITITIYTPNVEILFFTNNGVPVKNSQNSVVLFLHRVILISQNFAELKRT